MARTLIRMNTIARAGIQPDLNGTDSGNGMYFLNDGRTFIYALKAASGVGTLIFLTPGTVDTKDIANRSVEVAEHATEGMFIGPFPPSIYNNQGTAAADNGTVHVDVSEDDDFTLEAFRLPA